MGFDRMMPALYRAAVEGKHEDYYEALRQTAMTVADNQVTPSGNTVLHVAALHGQKQFVENILETEEDRVASSMLFSRNNKDETVLQCAAEKGYADIVSLIITATKKYKDVELGVGVTKMIGMRDKVKDTALHKAVRMGHLEVVKLLVKEDSEFEYHANDDGETPIYIAAELQFHGCLVEMLNTCKKPTYGGPLGRNALHAAILSGIGYTNISKSVKILFLEYRTESSCREFATECTQSLLEKKMCLCEEIDDFGWSPLHYAVKIYNIKAARMILERKPSAAYIYAGSDKEWTTTFHIAARKGKVEMMKEILNMCPDCWEMVNSKGQNVLHEAILSKKVNVIRHIESYDHFDNLIHQKDEDGNTPLHLLAVNRYSVIDKYIKERRMLNYFAFNKKHQTPIDIAVSGYKLLPNVEIREGSRALLNSRKFANRIRNIPEHEDNISDKAEKEIEAMIGMGKTSIVVATLILTMTFAAGITVPGGYQQEKGYPLLLRNTAFKAFVITNTLAFLCSFCSIVIHIAMVSEASRYSRSFGTVASLIFAQGVLLAFSCYGVVIAFLCAMYVILVPLLPLAITDLILGIFIFIFAFSVCTYYYLYAT
ncbi:protein ACCELERATED CELL DEATH 6-like [Ipomoea triloba]|uniref:protein ACCELERATED CELL DEATH 6-like n=1 Tax=Ipomoea triloba TaxID=35885 RepID=UPI00125D909A|nr:protein ACCELERATED CELL DEATH 6-like [Ipomoea triloba]